MPAPDSPPPVLDYAPPPRRTLAMWLTYPVPLRPWLTSWQCVMVIGLLIGLSLEHDSEVWQFRLGCYLQTFFFLLAARVGWKKPRDRFIGLERSGVIAVLVVVWLLSNIMVGRTRTGTYYIFKPFGRIHIYNGWVGIPPAEMKSVLGAFGRGTSVGRVVEDYE